MDANISKVSENSIKIIDAVLKEKKDTVKMKSVPVNETEIQDILTNLNNWPYRGLITKIAKARGVAVVTVWQSITKSKNKFYLGVLKYEAQKRINAVGMCN